MLTDINPKALEHACQCAGRSVHHFDRMALDLSLRASIVAHARAIEQHEAFKREVSDEIVKLGCWPDTVDLARFIIAKPDPLAEVLRGIGGDDQDYCNYDIYADEIRAAIEARGGRIVWEGE